MSNMAVVKYALVLSVLFICLHETNGQDEVNKRRPGWGKRTVYGGDLENSDDIDKRRPGWGKRMSKSDDNQEFADDVVKRRPGWGKRSDNIDNADVDKRRPGWGKRSFDVLAKRRPGWGKRGGMEKRRPGWGKRSEDLNKCQESTLLFVYHTQKARKAKADVAGFC